MRPDTKQNSIKQRKNRGPMALAEFLALLMNFKHISRRKHSMVDGRIEKNYKILKNLNRFCTKKICWRLQCLNPDLLETFQICLEILCSSKMGLTADFPKIHLNLHQIIHYTEKMVKLQLLSHL